MDIIPESASALRDSLIFNSNMELCNIISNINIENPLEKRSSDEILKDLRRVINLISLDQNNELDPVGSASYVIHKYPGDIDLMETFQSNKELNILRSDLVRQFQNIVKRIINTQSHENPIYMTDFKAGEDNRYDFYIGEIDKYTGKIVDYDPNILIQEFNNLLEQNLLTESEHNEIYQKITLFENPPSLSNYYDILNFIRRFKTIRWSENDIIQGYKILRGNKKLFLYDAIIMGTVVKLDVIAPIEYNCVECDSKCITGLSRYVEVTNWFMLTREDIYGKIKNLTTALHYKDGLISDIFKYSNEIDPEYNILKAAKRTWALGAYLVKSGENIELGNMLLKTLSSLMSSYIAILNSTKADLETVILIAEKNLNISIEYLGKSLESIALRLFCYDKYDLRKDITEKIYNDIHTSIDTSNPIILKDTLKYIKKMISLLTLEYLKCVNMDLRKIIE